MFISDESGVQWNGRIEPKPIQSSGNKVDDTPHVATPLYRNGSIRMSRRENGLAVATPSPSPV